MNRLTRTLTVAVCLAVIPACNLMNPKQATLTDQQVAMYIKAYKNIKQVAPNLAQAIGKDPKGQLNPGQAGFEVIEKSIKQAGFKDAPEFVRVNAAVAFALSQGQGQAFMGEMSAAHQKACAEIDAKLKDPTIPAPVKERLKMAKQSIEANDKQNEGWAHVAMSLNEPFTDKASMAVVMKHKKELEAAFTGR